MQISFISFDNDWIDLFELKWTGGTEWVKIKFNVNVLGVK